MRRRLISSCAVLVAVSAAAILPGCANRPNLDPAPNARTISTLPEAAVSEVRGVKVVAQSDSWTGEEEITLSVTPIRVEIMNGSDKPLRLRYDYIALLNGQGERYAAIPPLRVEGTLSEPVLVGEMAPIRQPSFFHKGFYVAPYLAPVYPGFTAYDQSFYYDPDYHGYYYRYWQQRQLPTAHMLEQALPEGVLEAGGSVTGFVYFELVDSDDERVVFVADLIDAHTGQVLGRASIPFTVTK